MVMQYRCTAEYSRVPNYEPTHLPTILPTYFPTIFYLPVWSGFPVLLSGPAFYASMLAPNSPTSSLTYRTPKAKERKPAP